MCAKLAMMFIIKCKVCQGLLKRRVYLIERYQFLALANIKSQYLEYDSHMVHFTKLIQEKWDSS